LCRRLGLHVGLVGILGFERRGRRRRAVWLSDGSGFLFIGGTSDTDWSPSLLAYDMKAGTVSSLVGGASPTDTAITTDGKSCYPSF
jgi:hypothetical protein